MKYLIKGKTIPSNEENTGKLADVHHVLRGILSAYDDTRIRRFLYKSTHEKVLCNRPQCPVACTSTNLALTYIITFLKVCRFHKHTRNYSLSPKPTANVGEKRSSFMHSTAIIIATRKSCTGRSPVRSIGHARSCRRRVAT